jgi:hypothetical protein
MVNFQNKNKLKPGPSSESANYSAVLLIRIRMFLEACQNSSPADLRFEHLIETSANEASKGEAVECYQQVIIGLVDDFGVVVLAIGVGV